MTPEPMNQNQKFALLVFGLVALAVVVGVSLVIRGDLQAMMG